MALSFSIALKKKWLGAAAGHTSLKGILTAVQINLYSSARPASPEVSAPSGTSLLAEITYNASGGTFVDADTSGILKKDTNLWTDASANNAGQAVWFRLFIYGQDPTVDDTSTKTAIRIDGLCGTALQAGDLILPSLQIIALQAVTVDVFSIQLP